MVIVLIVLLFLSRELGAGNIVYGDVQQMKNDIVLNQRIKDIVYGLENGFRLTVLEALRTVPPKEEAAREYMCMKIAEWFKSYPDYRMYIGYIDPNDYSRAPSVQSAIEPCYNFLYVDLAERKVAVKDNGLIGYPYSLVGYRIAFMFEGEVYGTAFKALIPEGTEIG